MTKRYILPTWEEFSKDRMVLVGYTDDPFTVKVGDRPVRKDDYNAIREATAVEDGAQQPADVERITVSRELFEANFELVKAAQEFFGEWGAQGGAASDRMFKALKPFRTGEDEESERLVGKARGVDLYGASFKDLLDRDKGEAEMQGGWKYVFGPKPGASWADVGGGEEKPVRAADPAANKPRCGTCQFYGSDRGGYRRVCRRYPGEKPREFNDWCGEWRAK